MGVNYLDPQAEQSPFERRPSLFVEEKQVLPEYVAPPVDSYKKWMDTLQKRGELNAEAYQKAIEELNSAPYVQALRTSWDAANSRYNYTPTNNAEKVKKLTAEFNSGIERALQDNGGYASPSFQNLLKQYRSKYSKPLDEMKQDALAHKAQEELFRTSKYDDINSQTASILQSNRDYITGKNTRLETGNNNPYTDVLERLTKYASNINHVGTAWADASSGVTFDESKGLFVIKQDAAHGTQRQINQKKIQDTILPLLNDPAVIQQFNNEYNGHRNFYEDTSRIPQELKNDDGTMMSKQEYIGKRMRDLVNSKISQLTMQEQTAIKSSSTSLHNKPEGGSKKDKPDYVAFDSAGKEITFAVKDEDEHKQKIQSNESAFDAQMNDWELSADDRKIAIGLLRDMEYSDDAGRLKEFLASKNISKENMSAIDKILSERGKLGRLNRGFDVMDAEETTKGMQYAAALNRFQSMRPSDALLTLNGLKDDVLKGDSKNKGITEQQWRNMSEMEKLQRINSIADKHPTWEKILRGGEGVMVGSSPINVAFEAAKNGTGGISSTRLMYGVGYNAAEIYGKNSDGSRQLKNLFGSEDMSQAALEAYGRSSGLGSRNPGNSIRRKIDKDHYKRNGVTTDYHATNLSNIINISKDEPGWLKHLAQSVEGASFEPNVGGKRVPTTGFINAIKTELGDDASKYDLPSSEDFAKGALNLHFTTTGDLMYTASIHPKRGEGGGVQSRTVQIPITGDGAARTLKSLHLTPFASSLKTVHNVLDMAKYQRMVIHGTQQQLSDAERLAGAKLSQDPNFLGKLALDKIPNIGNVSSITIEREANRTQTGDVWKLNGQPVEGTALRAALTQLALNGVKLTTANTK